MAEVMGIFPFGKQVRRVQQVDDGRPKRLFVLGVYASAVHAVWRRDNKIVCRALAVASEPCIFWDGKGAAEIVSRISERVQRLAPEMGDLSAADERFNGPSGRVLDNHILTPLKVGRGDAWLSDLRPWSCANSGQQQATETYHKLIVGTRLRRAEVECASAARPRWTDEARRAQIIEELCRSQAPVLVTLGDEPLRHFVKPLGGPGRLAECTYGTLCDTHLNDLQIKLLPLAHPRQIGGLGSHSPVWRAKHEAWEREDAARVAAEIKHLASTSRRCSRVGAQAP